MPYRELIKNYENVRKYLRDFYLYGFRSRSDYDAKSLRTYDDTRRRIGSWLDEYMCFRNTPDGKIVFISIDSRQNEANPLFRTWKSKSFTAGDITLHFILMDILNEDEGLPLSSVMDALADYSEGFTEPRIFDESTVRKKLKEYISEGIVTEKKSGKKVLYFKGKSIPPANPEITRFFSETAPLGVIGSFIDDKNEESCRFIRIKHHYLTDVLDSDVLLSIFIAMRQNMPVKISYTSKNNKEMTDTILPLKIKVSTQNGREYVMGRSLNRNRITSTRIDRITGIKPSDEVMDRERAVRQLESMEPFIWGVVAGGRKQHILLEIRYEEYEKFIPQRLMRERRNGKVTVVRDGLIRFEADVYDLTEMVPWLRTFIGRIVTLQMSDKKLEQRFMDDIREMGRLYAVQ